MYVYNILHTHMKKTVIGIYFRFKEYIIIKM